MEERNLRKTRVGIVVSDKMDKTVTVAVEDNVFILIVFVGLADARIGEPYGKGKYVIFLIGRNVADYQLIDLDISGLMRILYFNLAVNIFCEKLVRIS